MSIIKLRPVALACLMLICVLYPATGASVPDGPAARAAAADAREHTYVPPARATSVDCWFQSDYRDLANGTTNGTLITNRSGGELTLRSVAVQSFTLANESITAASGGPLGTVVLGTSKGDLYSINSTTFEIQHCGRAVVGEGAVTALTLGTDGTVWGGTLPSGKLFRMDTDGAVLGLGVAVAGETEITAMTTASDGTIWAGTAPNGRVFKVSPFSNAVTPYSQAVGGETIITALVAVSGGRLWGGTAPTGQLFQLDTSTGGYSLKGKIASDATRVTSMVFTSGSQLWAACDGAGGRLSLLNIAGGAPVEWSAVPVTGESAVNCLAEDYEGKLWGGTGNGSRLFWFDPSSKAVVKTWNVLPGEQNITALCRGTDGSIWGGTQVTPKIVSVSPARASRIQPFTMDRSRSGRLFFDNFDQLRGGKPGAWNEVNLQGGSWGGSAESGRGNVYVQSDSQVQDSYTYTGDPGWSDYYLDAMVKVTGYPAVDPNGNGGRLAVRSDPNLDRYIVNLYEPQDNIEFRKTGTQTAIVATYPTSIPLNSWQNVRVSIHSQTIDIWYNDTIVTPQIGQQTTGNYAKGMISLSARKATVRYDDVGVFRDITLRIDNLASGQKVTLYNETGSQLVSGTAVGSSVMLDVEKFHFPLRGYFNITKPGSSDVAYTSHICYDIWGGDIYSLNLSVPKRYYLSGGDFFSTPYDALYSAPWREIYFGSQKPAGTNVSIYVRGAATQAELGSAPWSSPVDVSGSMSPSSPSRWLQYRVNLRTSAELSAPTMDYINITYDILPPDIAIIKTVSKDRCIPGEEVDFTIELENNGQGLALETIVNDTLPAGLDFVNSSAESARNGTFWNFSNITPGEKRSFTITARLNGSLGDGMVIENRAQVTATDKGGSEMEPSLGNASFTVIAPVLELSLKPQSPTVRPGNIITLNATIQNIGGATARELRLIISPPFSGALQSYGGDLTKTGTYNWSAPLLEPGNYANLTMDFIIAALPVGLTVNAGMKVSCTDDMDTPHGPFESSCIVTVRNNLADNPVINITPKATPERPLPGSSVTFSFQLENTGGNNTTAVKTLTKLSPQLILPSKLAEVQYNLTNITSGGKVVVNITALVNTSVQDGDVLWANMTLNYSDDFDVPFGVASANCCATVSAPRISAMKIALSMTASPGQEVMFAVIFNNNGSAPEPELVIKELPPPGLTFVCATVPPESSLTWRFRNVQLGTNSFFITFKVNQTAALGGITVNRIQLNGSRGFGNITEASLIISLPPQTDFVQPAVLMHSPKNDEKNVLPTENIEVLFSEPMNHSAAEAGFSINPKPGGRFVWDGNKLIYKPSKVLNENTVYEVKLTARATDVAGNQLATNVTFTFTTRGIAADFTSVAFGMAAVLFAIVVVETIILLMMRRKWKGKQLPPEEGAEEEQGPPPELPPSPVTFGKEDAKDEKKPHPPADLKSILGDAHSGDKKQKGDMEMPVREDEEVPRPTTYSMSRRDRKVIPSGKEGAPANEEPSEDSAPGKPEEPEDDIDEDADPLGAMLQKGGKK